MSLYFSKFQNIFLNLAKPTALFGQTRTYFLQSPNPNSGTLSLSAVKQSLLVFRIYFKRSVNQRFLVKNIAESKFLCWSKVENFLLALFNIMENFLFCRDIHFEIKTDLNLMRFMFLIFSTISAFSLLLKHNTGQSIVKTNTY